MAGLRSAGNQSESRREFLPHLSSACWLASQVFLEPFLDFPDSRVFRLAASVVRCAARALSNPIQNMRTPVQQNPGASWLRRWRSQNLLGSLPEGFATSPAHIQVPSPSLLTRLDRRESTFLLSRVKCGKQPAQLSALQIGLGGTPIRD